MLRYALAPVGPTPEQVLVAIPRRATHWTIAQRNRGMHRILVPVDGSPGARDALRYVAGSVGSHVEAIHLLNVQRPLMVGDVTPLVDGRVVAGLRQSQGERILCAAGETIVDSGIPVTHEVAFGPVAQTICRVAEKRECTGIVIGVGTGFELVDLIVGSMPARVIRLAGVPVTIVNARAAKSATLRNRHTSPAFPDRAERACEAHVPVEVAQPVAKRIDSVDVVPT